MKGIMVKSFRGKGAEYVSLFSFILYYSVFSIAKYSKLWNLLLLNSTYNYVWNIGIPLTSLILIELFINHNIKLTKPHPRIKFYHHSLRQNNILVEVQCQTDILINNYGHWFPTWGEFLASALLIIPSYYMTMKTFGKNTQHLLYQEF